MAQLQNTHITGSIFLQNDDASWSHSSGLGRLFVNSDNKLEYTDGSGGSTVLSNALTSNPSIGALSNVSISGTPDNNAVLKYNSSTSMWELGTDNSGTAGSTTFIGLSDVIPNSFSGEDDKFVRVESTGGGLGFEAAGDINLSDFNNDLSNLTVDNTTVQLNSGITYNAGAAKTISAKTAAVADGSTALATGDQIYDFVTTNALMDSEVTNLDQVKAFDSTDYATAAQGTTADNALPKSGGQMTGNITFSGAQTVDGRDLSADGSKLDGIEAGADVTDPTNVAAAGALMVSEVDENIKTLSLPASTTITPFGATLVDDTDAAAARTTLGLGSIATLNSIDISANTNLAVDNTEITLNEDTLSLSDSGVIASTYGNASSVPQITVDAKGRITSVTNVSISGGGSIDTSGTPTSGSVAVWTDSDTLVGNENHIAVVPNGTAQGFSADYENAMLAINCSDINNVQADITLGGKYTSLMGQVNQTYSIGPESASSNIGSMMIMSGNPKIIVNNIAPHTVAGSWIRMYGSQHTSNSLRGNIIFQAGEGDFSNSPGIHEFKVVTAAKTSGGFDSTTETVMCISGSNVGIGISNSDILAGSGPDQALEVAGAIHISEEQGSAITQPSDGDGGILYTKADGKIYWVSNELSETDLTATGGGGGSIDTSGTPTSGSVAVWTDSDTLVGESSGLALVDTANTGTKYPKLALGCTDLNNATADFTLQGRSLVFDTTETKEALIGPASSSSNITAVTLAGGSALDYNVGSLSMAVPKAYAGSYIRQYGSDYPSVAGGNIEYVAGQGHSTTQGYHMFKTVSADWDGSENGDSTLQTVLSISGSNVGIGISESELGTGYGPDQALEVRGAIHISEEQGSAIAQPNGGDGGILYTKADGKIYWVSNELSETDLTATGGGGGGGTVTNITTGDGINGGPITTTGEISVDSTVVRTNSNQIITANHNFTGNLSFTGNLNFEGNLQIFKDSGDDLTLSFSDNDLEIDYTIGLDNSNNSRFTIGSGTNLNDPRFTLDGYNVSFGNTSATHQITGETAINGGLSVESTDGGASAGPHFTLKRDSSTPAANDEIGIINFQGMDSGGSVLNYARIMAGIQSPNQDANRHAGRLIFYIKEASDGQTEVLRLEGSNGYVGIQETSPSKMLDVFNGAAGGNILCRDIYTHDGGVHTSDERLKENIEDSDLGLDFIKSLRPVKYKWKDKEEYHTYKKDGVTIDQTYPAEINTRTHYGLIAQEVKQAVEDSGKTTTDFAGYCYEEDRDVHALRYQEIMGPMIKAMQEQQDLIETLMARVQELENKIN